MKKLFILSAALLTLTVQSCTEHKPDRVDKSVVVLIDKADKKWNKWLEKENADSVWNAKMK